MTQMRGRMNLLSIFDEAYQGNDLIAKLLPISLTKQTYHVTIPFFFTKSQLNRIVSVATPCGIVRQCPER